jgi:hypothetical protein
VDSETITVTTFFDEAGDPIKIATRAYFSGTITNTASGHTFRDHAFTETIKLPKAAPRSRGSANTVREGGPRPAYRFV